MELLQRKVPENQLDGLKDVLIWFWTLKQIRSELTF